MVPTIFDPSFRWNSSACALAAMAKMNRSLQIPRRIPRSIPDAFRRYNGTARAYAANCTSCRLAARSHELRGGQQRQRNMGRQRFGGFIREEAHASSRLLLALFLALLGSAR